MHRRRGDGWELQNIKHDRLVVQKTQVPQASLETNWSELRFLPTGFKLQV